MNVPGTYPAWRINGEMITGMLSPSISCYPSELKFFLENNWIIDGDDISDSFMAFDIKSNLFLRKMKENFDFMTYIIRIPDNLTHRSHGGRAFTLNLIYQVYLKIDKFLGKILKNESIENIFIFSDHGLRHYKKGFYLRRWLEKKKILCINEPKPNKLSEIILKFYDTIRRILKSNYLKKFYQRLINLNLIEERETKSIKVIEKHQTRVKGFCSYIGGLFLYGNDKKKKEEIKYALAKCKYIHKLIMPSSDDFPDFFIFLKDKYYFCDEPSFYIKRRRDIMDHSELGFFIAHGRNIKTGKKNIVSYQNIAPTILKLFNTIKPDYMMGEALDIFKNQ